MDQAVIKKLVFPSNLAEADTARQTVLADVTAHRYDENACFAIRLALDEALSNAIHHGNHGDPAKKVTVEYSVSDERVSVSVSDEGAGFDPKEVPDPTENGNLEKPHGRGIMLMRAYMTEVDFSSRGTQVTMVKHRGCKLPLRRRH